ncbi:MAG TPA: zinc metallopeptidase [Anaerolineae bacterium]|nr:zinc metallopeptidase [Anaerolineae bacterium]HOR00667.1 zinc metallopeptidase [Anaerolineae bacterium]HPL28816.1 zinc metallopeptidase [Anaerolineae bacterium]
MPFFFGYYNILYFVFGLPALLLALYAQFKVRSAYSKYTRVANDRRLTGLDAARYLLSANGLGHVNVEGTAGELTDHYDPRSKTLRLSRGVATSPSVASLGIVAHEVGHAVQDATSYLPLRLRAGMVPVLTLGSYLGPILFMIGLLFRSFDLALVGVVFFAAAAVFAIVTLPVELNASRRGLQMLQANGLVVSAADTQGVKSVLSAAALTYVAAVAQALSTLLYYVFLLSGMRRRD